MGRTSSQHSDLFSAPESRRPNERLPALSLMKGKNDPNMAEALQPPEGVSEAALVSESDHSRGGYGQTGLARDPEFFRIAGLDRPYRIKLHGELISQRRGIDMR